MTAASPDTEDFIEWVLATKSDDRIKESVAIRFLELKSKRQPKPYAPSTRKTGDLMVGEMVYVDASKNTNPMNTDTCDLYNGKVATITGVTSDGLTCSLHNGDKANYSVDLSGQKAFFTGFASGKSTGLFRYTAKSDFVDRFDGPKILFEAVYLRKESTKVDPGRIEEIEAYVDRGSMMGQTRSRNYYTGTLGTFAISEKDQMYFGLVAQQRESVQSTMNPTTGKLRLRSAFEPNKARYKAGVRWVHQRPNHRLSTCKYGTPPRCPKPRSCLLRTVDASQVSGRP